jgi:lysophospholipase L1-like esterase
VPNAQENRYIPAHADAFAHPLPWLAKRLAEGGPVNVVAIGSSSTAGEGQITPYPARLQAALRSKYGERVNVLNQGKGGEEAPDEILRMNDVIGERPALVIWQVGTNAVWQTGHNLDDVAAAIAVGLKRFADEPMDVVLMDLQYVPALLTDDKIAATRRMLALITQAAAGSPGVNVFHRFAMMRQWRKVEKFSFDTILDPGDETRLHQSDYTTRRVAFELGETIAVAVARQDGMSRLAGPDRRP